MLPGLAAGAGVNIGANLATDAMKSEDDVYARLCSIDSTLKALLAYSQRERERTPYVAELRADFVAGVLTAASNVPLDPPSSISVDFWVVTVDAAAEVVLQMGTRGPSFWVNPGASPSVLPLPYHLNGGARVQLGVVGVPNVAIRAFAVGWLEQNRLGPQKVIGMDL